MAHRSLCKNVTSPRFPILKRILDQMEFYYREQSAYSESWIVSRLPPKFRKELLLTMHKSRLVRLELRRIVVRDTE